MAAAVAVAAAMKHAHPARASGHHPIWKRQFCKYQDEQVEWQSFPASSEVCLHCPALRVSALHDAWMVGN